jgi:hypothetical protein
MEDQTPSRTAASSCTMMEYLTFFEECEYMAAHIHPLYREQYDNVAAMMSAPAGMTNASIDDLHPYMERKNCSKTWREKFTRDLPWNRTIQELVNCWQVVRKGHQTLPGAGLKFLSRLLNGRSVEGRKDQSQVRKCQAQTPRPGWRADT